MSWLLASLERSWTMPHGLVRSLMFWAQPASTPVPVKVRNVLLAKHNVSQADLAGWRWSGTPGRLNGRSVRYFRVFNPSLAGGKGAGCTYADLDEAPGAVLFDGYIDEDGYVSVSPRRSGGHPANFLA